MHCISKATSRRLSRIARLRARDGCGCVWCGRKLDLVSSTIEHVIPLSEGGANIFENMLIACGDCNHRRQSVEANEWLRRCQDLGFSSNKEALARALATLASLMRA